MNLVDLLKKNIVMVPVVASLVVGTFTGVRYIDNLTDTINASEQEIVNLQRDLDQAKKNITDINTRLSSGKCALNEYCSNLSEVGIEYLVLDLVLFELVQFFQIYLYLHCFAQQHLFLQNHNLITILIKKNIKKIYSLKSARSLF